MNAWLLITLLHLRNSANFHRESFHELSTKLVKIFPSQIIRILAAEKCFVDLMTLVVLLEDYCTFVNSHIIRSMHMR